MSVFDRSEEYTPVNRVIYKEVDDEKEKNWKNRLFFLYNEVTIAKVCIYSAYVDDI